MSASSPQPSFILRGHASSVTVIHFHRPFNDSVFVISGDVEGKIKFWNLDDRRCAATIEEKNEINSPQSAVLQITPRADSLIIQRKNGQINFIAIDWKTLKVGAELWRINTGAYGFFRCTIGSIGSPSENFLICPATPASNFHLVDIEHRRLIATAEAESSTGEIEPNDSHQPQLVDGVLELRGVLSHRRYGKKHGMFMAAIIYQVTAAANNNINIIAAMEGGSIIVFNVDIKNQNVSMFASLSLTVEPLLAVALCGEGDINFNTDETLKLSGVTGGSELSIRPFTLNYQVDAGEVNVEIISYPSVPLAASTVHSGLNALAFIDNGENLATAGWDHRVRIFNCQNFKPKIENISSSEKNENPPILSPASLLRCHTKSVQCLNYIGENNSSNSSRSVIPISSSSALAKFSLSSRLAAAKPRRGWLATGGEDAHIAIYER